MGLSFQSAVDIQQDIPICDLTFPLVNPLLGLTMSLVHLSAVDAVCLYHRK